jgi:cell wall-associated NlpC family hydrolase
MGLAVDASRLLRSWGFTGIVLISAVTLLTPSISNAVATESSAKNSRKTKPASKGKAAKKVTSKGKSTKAKVAKASASPVAKSKGKASRKASVARGKASTTKKVVAARPAKSGKRVASRSKRHGAVRRAVARAPRLQPYLPNVDDYEVLTIAARHLGTPYRFGGASAGGFDCSGLVRTVFAEVGTALPHSAREQFTMGERISSNELQPGDLVFFRTYRAGASHVGIYVGDGLFIHAASRGGEVKVDSLDERYFSTRYLGARRVRGSDS